MRTKIRKTSFEKQTDVNYSKTIHTVERIDGNNIFVSDRKMSYKGDELLKVNDGNESNDVKSNAEDEKLSKEREIDIKLKRVGVDMRNVVNHGVSRSLRRSRRLPAKLNEFILPTTKTTNKQK